MLLVGVGFVWGFSGVGGIGGSQFIFFGKLSLHSVLRAIEMKPVKALSRPKSPRCKLLFCLVLVFFWGRGVGMWRGLSIWRNLSSFGVSENCLLDTSRSVVS